MKRAGIALILLLLLVGGRATQTAEAQGTVHRFSGAPTDFLVEGSERTLNFLLIAQTADGVALAQDVIDPTGSWSLNVPTAAAGGQIIFVMAEPGDPSDVRGTTDPLHLIPGADTRLVDLDFFSLQPPAFDISGEWEFLITISLVGGGCTDAGSSTTTATIDQTGGGITLDGLDSPTPWLGFISGDRVIFNGTRPEAGGLTQATFGFALSDDGHQMFGVEYWTWSGAGINCPGSESIVTATQISAPPDPDPPPRVDPAHIDATLNVPGDAQRDGEGKFYEAISDDGSVTVRVRDLPPGVQAIDLFFTPLELADIPLFPPRDEELIGSADGIASAGEVLLFDANSGDKIDASLDVILAPLAVADPQFLLWLFETPGGRLVPVEFTVALDGTLTARFPIDLFFIILDMPAPQANLRPGLNALVYTGPEMPADRAFPGGEGRGSGIDALWRFTGFGFEAFFSEFPTLVNPTYRLYDPLFVVAESGGAFMQQGLLVSVRRQLSLAGGDNLVSYTGAVVSILNVVEASVIARARAIWVWRDSVGAWLGFFPGQPAAIQGITSLALGDLIFIHTSSSVGWDMR